MHVKKGDNVLVITGGSKGKTGKVSKVFPLENKVLVEGVNVRKVFVRSKKQTNKKELAEKAFPIHISNVKKTK